MWTTIQVTDAVRALLPALEAQLPPAAHLTPRQDRSRTIRAAFTDIQLTMVVTLALVVGVLDGLVVFEAVAYRDVRRRTRLAELGHATARG